LDGQCVALDDLFGVAAENFTPALLELNLHVKLLFVIKKVYKFDFFFVQADDWAIIPLNNTLASQ